VRSRDWRVFEEVFEAFFRELDSCESAVAASAKDKTNLETETLARVRAKQVIFGMLGQMGFFKTVEKKKVPNEFE